MSSYHLGLFLTYLPVSMLIFIILECELLLSIFVLTIFISVHISYLLFNHYNKPIVGHEVIICDSPKSYHNLILKIEADASEIDRIQKRIGVIFKSEELIRSMALSRFGHGSSNIKEYVEEHLERKHNFFKNLENGHLKCREIYREKDLESYIKLPKHLGINNIEKRHVEYMLNQMITTLRDYPGRYQIGITSSSIPFKYQIFRGKINGMVLHEAVGGRDQSRLTAIGIMGSDAEQRFTRDFNKVWDAIPNDMRNPNKVIEYLEKL